MLERKEPSYLSGSYMSSKFLRFYLVLIDNVDENASKNVAFSL